MVEKIKTALHGQHGLKSATILLAVTLFLSNVLGLVRNILLASRAHDLGQLDSYYAAFRLPDLIFNILILGAISSAFIPVYSETLTHGGFKPAQKLANTLLGSLLFGVVLGIVCIWIAAPYAVPLLVHNFSANQQIETVHLTRIMLLSPLFFTLSYVSGAVLNAHKRFVSYSIAPLIYNCSIIAGAILLPWLGVEAVAWSVVIGSALHFAFQLPTLSSMGFRLLPRIDFNDISVRRIVTLTIPRTFSIAITQASLLVFTVIASSLHAGALTIFSLANDLQTTPAIIFGASLATAVFPSLSHAVAQHSTEDYQRYLHRTLRISIFMIVPVTLFTILLRAQIMRLYIGLGHNISWTETIRAIQALQWFTISFLAQAFVFILARAFYALQDTKRPMYASLCGTAVTVILAFALPHTAYFSVNVRDVASLAAAYSVGMILQALLLIWWLPQQWRGSLLAIVRSFQMTFVISIIASFALWITLRLIGQGLAIDGTVVGGIGTNTIIKVAFQALLASVVGGLVFYGLARNRGMDELAWAMRVRKSYGQDQE